MKPAQHLQREFTDVYLSTLKYIEELISQPTSVYGLSFEQWLIMDTVANAAEPVTLTQLATQRNVTKGAIARQMKPLLDQNYLEQQTDPSDRRRSFLQLSATGEQTQQEIARAVEARFSNWIEVFGADDAQQLLGLLRRFDDVILRQSLRKN